MVVDNNPFDCVTVELPSFKTDHSGLRNRIYNLFNLHRLNSRPLCLIPKRPFTKQLNMYLLIANADQEDLQNCETIINQNKKDTTLGNSALSISAQSCEEDMKTSSKNAAMQSMSNVLKRQLKNYGTTINEDQFLLDTSRKERTGKVVFDSRVLIHVF